ncbi:hypothetical protein C0J50_13346 [Silurus asotus]|uniref:Uncharacterized protein n=1 Tax=Silurus asotus TaxID=30991 RepID=A0AAD5FSP1_SILAS|nr:hypothetical protein C0J50_13346 [Silurus asotus]
MSRFWNELLMVLMLTDILIVALARKEGKARRRKVEGGQDTQPQRSNSTSFQIPLDPILTGDHTAGAGEREMDFDKAIDDMVSQVRNNPALSKSKCVVDRHLWMSNSRSLSPWSYR